MMRSFVINVLRIQFPIWLVIPLLGLMMICGIGIGYVGFTVFQPSNTCPETPDVCQRFGVFWQVWDLASENFVDAQAIQPDKMTEGAINGMLDSLGDQGHTRFLTAESAKRWDQALSGEYEGIGAYLDMLNGRPIISEPIEGSPAAKAGLMAGDYVVKIDGQETTGWALEDVAAHIRGPKGTSVHLTLQRANQEALITVSIKRDKVELPSVRWEMLPNHIAFVRLTTFSQRSADEMKKALTEAKAQGAQKLLLDLRNNLGGLVNEAIGITSQFLPEGTTMLLEEDRTNTRTPTKTIAGGVALDIPMVVLINANTASSAEILAGALQDHKRAQLIGVGTVGTGTVLTPYTLEGGAKLLLGTVQWLTPNGRLIRGKGIIPDIQVALPPGAELLTPGDAGKLSKDELLQSRDTQFVRAIEMLEKLGK